MEWLLFIVLLAIALLWWDGTAAKEIAVRRARQRCQQTAVLFLDDSVALSQLRLRRHPAGSIAFQRRYAFEFCTDGQHRYAGYVEVLGRVVQHIHMDAYRMQDDVDTV
ncbi:MAG: DUF3301 domain-containing protein [Gammaproteobacteria bacterium]